MIIDMTEDMADATGAAQDAPRQDATQQDTPPQAQGPVRTQHFDATGPLELDLAVGAGRVTVALVEQPGVTVSVRYDPSAGNSFLSGLSNVLNWFNGQFGEGGEVREDAIEETRIELIGSRLVVHTQKRYFAVPLSVTVRAPARSHLELSAGSAEVRVTGPAGRVKLSNGSGDVSLDRADGPAEVKSGSGALRLGPMLAGLTARSGSGEIEVSSIGGTTSLVTGSGDVWLGTVQSDVRVRTGSGDLTVADAASGSIDLTTGSGEIRIGVRSGTRAQVDLRSGSGQARSELPLATQPPAEGSTLAVRGHTGSGNAVISAAIG